MSNPYAAPKAAVTDEAAELGEYIPGGQAVPASHGWTWIAEGWELFKMAPGPWVGISLVFGLWLLLPMIPILGLLASLLTPFFTPVLVGGIMIGCRSLDEGRGLEFNHLFEGFKTHFGSLVLVGAISFAITIVIMVVVFVLVAAVMGASLFGVMTGGEGQEISPETLKIMGLGALLAILVFIALALPVTAAMWFAPALVTGNNLAPVEAMKASLVGCLRNILPMLVYGIILLVPTLLATIPLLLGWLILGPIMAASVYAGYKDIYLR